MAKMTITATETDNSRDELIQYMIDHYYECIDMAMQKAAPRIKRDFNKICRTAVARFYGDYTPFVYRRTNSLYKMYRFVLRGSEMHFLLGGELSNGSHAINEPYIFDTVFKLGMHGGAKPKHDRKPWMTDDGYYWRYPSPGSKAAVGGKEAFSEWYKDPEYDPYEPEVGIPVPQAAESPYQEIVREWKEYVADKGQSIINFTTLDVFADLIKKGAK